MKNTITITNHLTGEVTQKVSHGRNRKVITANKNYVMRRTFGRAPLKNWRKVFEYSPK
jgi:hypothetical protein